MIKPQNTDNVAAASVSDTVNEHAFKNPVFTHGILNSLSAHVAVINSIGIIIAINDTWKRYALENGETRLHRDNEGRNYYEVCEKSIKGGDEIAAQALQGIKDVMSEQLKTFHLEYACDSPDVQRWFSMQVMKLEGDDSLVVIAHYDITERKKSEDKHRISEERLKEAQAIGHIGNWEIDLVNNIHTWSDEMCRIFGIANSQQASVELFSSFIEQEHSMMIANDVSDAFSKRKSSSFNFSFIRSDGETRYGYSEYRLEFDAAKKPVRLYGIVQDITERKLGEENLLKMKQHLTEAQNLAKIGNWNFDVAKNELFWSDTFRTIYGIATDYVTNDLAASFSVVYVEDRDRVWQELMNTQKSGHTLTSNYRIVRPDTGEVRTLRGITNAELDAAGKLIRMYGIVEDITELNNAQEELHNSLIKLEHRVEERTKELSEKNKSITDSINYAKRIQVGLLTRPSHLKELFPKSFIIFKPQQIVSGDFFWCHQSRSKKFVVVADCTGHGVPGALMSIIANNLLEQIIVNEHIENPSEIFELLDTRLKETMQSDTEEVRDGMDIVLCVIDSAFNEIYFTGALRPLFASDDKGDIVEWKGNSCAIGGGIGEVTKKFETQRFSIIPGQRIYLTSDGYYSQFGGKSDKKFMKDRFITTLKKLQVHPVEEQKNILEQVLTEWKGNNEQVDDILVIGIEL
jgi:PAS domain S-box-containing protein